MMTGTRREFSEIALECFYPYGFRGKTMLAVSAPWATTGEAPDLIGQIVGVGTARYRIVSISRQISGPIARGEPIGVEVRELPAQSGA